MRMKMFIEPVAQTTFGKCPKQKVLIVFVAVMSIVLLNFLSPVDTRILVEFVLCVYAKKGCAKRHSLRSLICVDQMIDDRLFFYSLF